MSSHFDDWINGRDAASILSQNSGHRVSADYVRLLSHSGKIRSIAIDGRTKLYCREDIERYTVRSHSKDK
ncbi:hypothetical protein KSF_083890 [Reticulibacter mediterranei]|uniref:Uncharacterized protein n=1 Tax=Reticulibacter mediterranei TaxID=2778369 RepID=A0A8J3IYE1_9CHLR|nr:hypothetical protein [Reticulibacter mediterranei]GHO98341.1 hypothetical protein KSF_083890 [Reticulibacter mediterranei]